MDNEIRSAFPFFATHPELIYLDSAATTQKPRPVIEAMRRHLESESANPGRGSYRLASLLSRSIEDVRAQVAGFLNAGDPAGIAFTSGATAALNAVAQCWGAANLCAGDEVLLSRADHAANVGPWLLLARQLGLTITEYGLTASGDPDLTELARKVTPATRVVVLTHVHNVFGERTSVAEIRARIGPKPIMVLDASQSAGHTFVDAATLGADFIAFSGHKMFGPPGIGVLWASSRVRAQLRPTVIGGGQAGNTGLAGVLEVGTLNTAGIIGLGSAITFIESIGMPAISARLGAMTRNLVAGLESMPHLELLPGIAFSTGCSFGYGIASFRVKGMQAADTGFVLDDAGICVRTGGHCTHDSELTGESVRISLHCYNTDTEIAQACDAIAQLARTSQHSTAPRTTQGATA